MDELLSAITLNVRESLKKVEGIRYDMRMLQKTKWKSRDKENLLDILKLLKECTAVIIIFDDLMEEVESKIKYKGKVKKGRAHPPTPSQRRPIPSPSQREGG